jgi:hypothetical protein
MAHLKRQNTAFVLDAAAVHFPLRQGAAHRGALPKQKPSGEPGWTGLVTEGCGRDMAARALDSSLRTGDTH